MGSHTIPYTDAEALAAAEAKFDDHSARHEDTGADEMDVVGLAGLLAADQHVLDAEVLAVAAAKLHESTHVSGGSDDIDSALVDAAIPNLATSKITSTRFPVDRLPAMTDEKIWKGTGANVEEVDMPGGYTEGARVYNSSDISLPASTLTLITFNSEYYDTDTIHSTVANTSRLTCQTAGKYLIVFNYYIAGLADGKKVEARIRKNGATILAMKRVQMGASDTMVQDMVTIADLSAADYVEVLIDQRDLGARDLRYYAEYTPVFMMQRIG